eukprot:tig00000692_g3230.t1
MSVASAHLNESQMPRRVIVTLDGSAPAKYALQLYAERLRKEDDELVLLAIAEPPTTGISDTAFPILLPDKSMRQRMLNWEAARAEHLLETSANDLKVRGITNVQMVVRSGSPREEIVKLAEDWSADLVIVGSRGLGAIKRLVLGSVSDYVVRNCSRPVLVVR